MGAALGAALANKTAEKFNNVIEVMKKYKLLDSIDPGIYEHIQTDVDIEKISRDENAAFSATIVGW